MKMLKFITAGSVDDGKSTLIGRLLYDSNAVSHDVLHTIERQTRNQLPGAIDLSLLTDGLRAEREQGITIDIAYKYFHTERRKFIIADAPGHVQYTRNMITGASNADLAIILIDARQGVVEQTHRHSLIASLVGIPNLIVAINKMDLVDYQQSVYEQIVGDYRKKLGSLGVRDIQYIPISALTGDNIVKVSTNMPWYKGKSLLTQLEEVEILPDRQAEQARFQVQYVIRPQSEQLPDYRGYAGSIMSGVLSVGDAVTILPSGISSTITQIEVNQKNVTQAFAPQPVVLHLSDDIDISRGDYIVPSAAQPMLSSTLDATICWMHERPLRAGDRLLLRYKSGTVKTMVQEIEYRLDVHSFEHLPATILQLNDIAKVRLRTAQPVPYDPYVVNRRTGSFILVQEDSGDTVAAGMFLGAEVLESVF